MKKQILFLTTLLAIVLLNCSTTPAQVLQQDSLALDSLALVAFYNSTGGPNWDNNANWLTGPVGTWYGVTVEGDRVVELGSAGNFSFNNLTGHLPSEIGDLTALQKLVPGNNPGLTGEIPAEIGNLQQLRLIGTGNCSLIGTIPNSIGNCTLIRNLSLRENNLTGLIPPEIGNLDSLIFLDLHDNQLTGIIPPELGNLENLEWLKLNNNLLTGTIPEEITYLENLELLCLQHNQLSGQLPVYLSNLFYPLQWDIISINVSNNLFSGPVPDEWGELSFYISSLDISNNHFTSLPDAQFNYMIDFFTLDFNDLRFEDLEPHYLMYLNGNYCTFDFEPQSTMMEEIDTVLIPGSSISIYAGTGGEHVLYYWLKNSQHMEYISLDTDTLHLENITIDDAGMYECEAVNTLVPYNMWRKPLHITIDTTGVGTQNIQPRQNQIYVYPNPAGEQVYLKFPHQTGVTEVRIFDMQGKIVFTKEISHIAQNASLNI
ncbi:MAG: hypothetical protein B6I19_07385, partial [Bacteroidetes bacterium 4572_114]